MELTFEVHVKIRRPIAEVFDAVYNPDKLKGYFTTGGASGPLVEGTTVKWAFADGPADSVEGRTPFPVRVTKVVPERLIELEWGAGEQGAMTQVRMKFEPLGATETMVSIWESGWHETQAGLDLSYQNCGGWMQMASCLKGFVEYGINLRDGFF
jgi:uncharacterized protein YndB with AHSA1/START domain